MLTQKQPWVVRAWGMSDKGRVRENNEDNLFYDEKQGLFIVSDGMGGHQAGEVASRIVVSVLPPMIEKLAAGIKESTQSKEPYQRVLRDAILQLSQDLRDESKGQAGLQGMGATVVVVWVLDQRAHMAYMGDSRIYLLRKGRLTQVSNDHSVVALLLRHRQITEEEAKDHPARGRLSRYVGMEGDTFSDQRTIVMFEGDRLLLCSDGLTGMVSDDHIEKVLREYQDPDKACKVLIRMANEAGGKDNITAIIINFETPHGTQESQKVSEQRQTPDQSVAPQTSMPVQHRHPEQAQSPHPQIAPSPQTSPEQPKPPHQQHIPVQQKPLEQPKSPRPPNIPPRPGKPESRLPEQQREGEKRRPPKQQEAPRRRVRGIGIRFYFGEISERRRPDDRHGKPDKPKPPRP
jgi:protein phosphatase